MKHLTVDQFLEAVVHMPEVEAEQEMLQRKDQLMLQFNLITAERQRLNPPQSKTDKIVAHQLGLEIAVIGHDLSRINGVLKDLRRRMERRSWAKAVTAVYGEQGYAACKLWMAQTNQDPRPIPDHQIAHLMRAAGMA